jgi:class 3 adenylate cyclase/tetratricopeptide (TPR) repeat protein
MATLTDKDAAPAVSRWLERLGLGQYAEQFSANDIDASLLPKLDHDTLQAIGVASVGHRLRILEAAATLGADAVPSPTGAPRAERPASEASAAAQGERRQLTVMFCDLVGSTELSGRLDPEVLREVVRAYQQAVEGVTQRFGGHVAQLLGDGLLVYFGYPVAHEDDAARAVHAALGIPEVLDRLNERLMAEHSVRLAARVGIHTGPVVVGQMGGDSHRESLAMGETPNLAARLQSLAGAGATVISGRTRQLIGHLFELEPLDEVDLKGIAAPTRAYVVTGERQAETRFSSRHGAATGVMAGRQSELSLLLDRWRQAKEGSGQVVVLTGEAGIGKSRIASALADAVEDGPHQRISYQCSPYHMGTTLHPVVRQLALAAEFAADDAAEAKLAKLERLLLEEEDDISTSAPLLGALLNLGDLAEARHGAIDLSPEQRRERTLQVLLDRLHRAAEQGPVLVVLEDAQWIDPTTLALVELMLDRIDRQRILLLMTARPGFAGSFGGHSVVSHLSLNRLGREPIAQMVEGLTEGKVLPAQLMREIATRTDGVPLFVEELTRALLESGQLRDTGHAYEYDGQLDALAIPSSLRDILMARLDRAHGIKEVAQIAACIGREFNWALLAAVSDLPREQLESALDQLVRAELIFRRGVASEATYVFKHALVRDAAYESLLKVQRRALHGALLAHLVDDDGVPPQILAQHAAAADRSAEAADYWERAGGEAGARSSFGEAIGHFEQARHCLRALSDPLAAEPGGPAGEHRLRLELRLAHACVAGRGHGSQLTAEVFKRAVHLAEGLGPSTMRVAAFYGYSVTQVVRGELREAAEVVQALAKEVAGETDDVRRLMAHCCLGEIALLMGEFQRAHEAFENVTRFGREVATADLIQHFGHEPRGVAHCNHAIAWWCLGDPQRASELWQAGMRLATDSDHTPSLAQPMVFGALLAMLARDERDLRQRVDEAVAFTERHGFQMWRGFAVSLRSAAELQGGDAAAALKSLRQGRTAIDATAARYLSPLVSLIEAQILAAAGDGDAAMTMLLDAQSQQDLTGERWMAAELWRSIGDLHRQSADSDTAAAKSAYQYAVDLARKQGAKSWELRAASSLASLRSDAGEG